MITYDFCIAWNWKYDADVVSIFNEASHSHGFSLLQVTPGNLTDILESLNNNRIAFRVFFDRASDTDKRFIPVDQWARDHAVLRINTHERAARSCNKATMHLDFITAGIQTPYTFIIPPYEKHPGLKAKDLSPLGDTFFIKPAHGGGGEGITREATSFTQVLIARQVKPADHYLLQAHISPVQLDTRPAWFRVIYCTGRVYSNWWDQRTHVYTPVTAEEENRYNLSQLQCITATIARVCELELFSTEIALTPEGLFVVVDYVNDQIDLRLKSKCHDGVPDDIVYDIAHRLINLAAVHSEFGRSP